MRSDPEPDRTVLIKRIAARDEPPCPLYFLIDNGSALSNIPALRPNDEISERIHLYLCRPFESDLDPSQVCLRSENEVILDIALPCVEDEVHAPVDVSILHP